MNTTVGYLVGNTSNTILHEYGSSGFPGGSDGKDSIYNAGDPGLFDPWVGKIPWRKWQPTPVFLPGEFHGQRILAGYSPQGRKESDTTEGLTFSLFTLSGTREVRALPYSTAVRIQLVICSRSYFL